MEHDLLLKCLRATNGSGEVTKGIGKSSVSLNESVEEVGEIKPDPIKMVPDDTKTVTTLNRNVKMEAGEDDDMDPEFVPEDDEYSDDEEGEDIPVIDTDLDADEEGEVDKTKYVGKYIVVCPICLNPIISDKPSGEVFCPVCNEDVEILEPVGQVVAPSDASDNSSESPEDSEGATDDAGTEGGEIQDDPEKSESLNESTESESDNSIAQQLINKLGDSFRLFNDTDWAGFAGANKFSDGSDPIISEVGDRIIIVGGNSDESDKFSIQVDESNDKIEKVWMRSDNLTSIDEVKEVIDSISNSSSMKDTGFELILDNPINEGKLKECTEINVCPQGNVEVSTDNTKVSIAASPSQDIDTEVEVDDFDTDSFDAEVNEIVPEVYSDEGVSYESVSVYKNGKGLVVEGKLSAGNNSIKVRFVSTESKSNANTFKVEGFKGLIGKIITENKYYKNSKKLTTESIVYKFLTKVEGKARVISNQKRG